LSGFDGGAAISRDDQYWNCRFGYLAQAGGNMATVNEWQHDVQD